MQGEKKEKIKILKAFGKKGKVLWLMVMKLVFQQAAYLLLDFKKNRLI